MVIIIQLLLSSLENELGKLEESNKILERLEKENILQSFELEINTKEFKNLQFIIANKFNEMKKNKNNCGPIKLLNNIDYSILTYEIYNSANVAQFSEVYTEHEYMEIINYIAIPFIIDIEKNNNKILKENLIKKFQERMILMNIKKKTKKIFKIIKKNFEKDDEQEDYISEVKKSISEKKDEDYKDIIELDIDINSVIFYLKTLNGKENISWLNSDKEKGKLSYNSLLYYYQNYNSED